MVFLSDLRPALVNPIPAGRLQIRRMMLATSLLIDGPVDQNPERLQPYLANTLLMPNAHLLIGGSLCRRPLVLREFANVCRAAQQDGVLVRLRHVDSADVSFDVKIAGDDRMLCAYILWMPRLAESAWLIPTAGSLPSVRLDPSGLEISDLPPFDCAAEKARGIQHASEYLSIALLGWF